MSPVMSPRSPVTTRPSSNQLVELPGRVFLGAGYPMSSLSGAHSLGGEPLCCGASQEKRPLLRGEAPQNCPTGNGISRREKSPDGTTAIIQIPMPAPERAEPRYKPEKCKTFVACIISTLCLLLNLLVLAYIHDRVPDRSKTPPLPDIFFDLFPEIDEALKVSEIIIIASVWTCVLLIVLHRYRWIVFRRVCVMMAALYMMRAITMFVTQVPVASRTYYCSPQANRTAATVIAKRVLTLFSGFGLSINGHHTYCGDYIFSGHTLILTLCYLIIKEYSPQRCRLLHLFYFCTSSIGVFCVLLARGHYLVDVVLGYYVTTRVFWIYHALCAAQQSSKVSSEDDTVSPKRDPSACESTGELTGKVLPNNGKTERKQAGPPPVSNEASTADRSQNRDGPRASDSKARAPCSCHGYRDEEEAIESVMQETATDQTTQPTNESSFRSFPSTLENRLSPVYCALRERRQSIVVGVFLFVRAVFASEVASQYQITVERVSVKPRLVQTSLRDQ
ncbi:phosphatidylcholine:ceramide cholinephosphotransferase 1-like [Tropilaelaps mercedesae]|uniref:Phosphatidylcholine:ceramide cholinephosphotransferase 1-like n=1 Tax=Tropilaelaps mercedesae TaxID=418985 RepID=A0A1V9X3P8_9ACAR|nr:phosphatidylcholine:ceramide cholinephosphotransferase 1-like [Tropilaelaps mercedesae]